ERGAAVAAEPLSGLVLGPARRADGSESGAAVAAEPLTGGILRAAGRAGRHRRSLERNPRLFQAGPALVAANVGVETAGRVLAVLDRPAGDAARAAVGLRG